MRSRNEITEDFEKEIIETDKWGIIMSLCDMLKMAKKDEESGVTEYGSLKSEITPEKEDYIDSVENIISDEKNHLNKVNEMIKYYGCSAEVTTKRRKRK